MNKKHLMVMAVFGVAFCAVAYLGWALLIKPVRKQILVKETEKEAVEKKLQDAKTKAAQYDKFKAQAENIRRDLSLISRRLDSDFSQRERGRIIGRLFWAISSMHTETIVFEKREKSKVTGFGTLDELPFTLTFKSGYHELGLYINSLISSQRMMVPMTMDIKINKDKDATIFDSPVAGTLKFSLFLESGGAK